MKKNLSLQKDFFMLKINYTRFTKEYLKKNPSTVVSVEKEEVLLGLLLNYPNHIFKIDERIFGCEETFKTFQEIQELEVSSNSELLIKIQHTDIFNYAFDLWKEHELELEVQIDKYIVFLEHLRILRLEKMCSELRLMHIESAENIDTINNFIEKEKLPKFDFEYKSVSDSIDEVEDDILNSDKMKGDMVGIYILDEVFGGIAPDDVVVLAARPGMGKTTFSVQFLSTLSIKNNTGILLNTLEVPRKRLITKFLSYFSGIPERDIRNNWKNCLQTEQYKSAKKKLQDLDIEICEYKYTPKELETEIRMVNARRKSQGKEPIKYVWQDYLQLKSADVYVKDETEKINYVLDKEIKLGKKLGFVLINLSQIGRNVETRGGSKRPTISDLKQSGKIEESARKILLLYRPEYYGIIEDENGDSLKDVLEVIVAKNSNGKTDSIFFKNIKLDCNLVYNPEISDEEVELFNNSFEDPFKDIPNNTMPRMNENDFIF